jgi:hypothetical protein
VPGRPLGPLLKLQTPLTYISQFSGLLCELVYAPGARREFCGDGRFFWQIYWDTGLTTGAAGSINAGAARSCREEREIELEYLMLIIPLKIAFVIFLVWMFMP